MAQNMKIIFAGRVCILAGFAGFVSATLWWYLFYSDVLRTDVKLASECFYYTTLGCAAENFLGSWISDFSVYRPEFLWASIVLIVIGLGLIASQYTDESNK